MVRIKVAFRDGKVAEAATDSKKKCSMWLSLIHQDWKTVDLFYGGKKLTLSSKHELDQWMDEHGQ